MYVNRFRMHVSQHEQRKQRHTPFQKARCSDFYCNSEEAQMPKEKIRHGKQKPIVSCTRSHNWAAKWHLEATLQDYLAQGRCNRMRRATGDRFFKQSRTAYAGDRIQTRHATIKFQVNFGL